MEIFILPSLSTTASVVKSISPQREIFSASPAPTIYSLSAIDGVGSKFVPGVLKMIDQKDLYLSLPI